jgi:dihydrofolate reductase
VSAPIIIIAAMSSDRVIGSGNGMPWDVPEEYAQFLRQVDGQTLVMGRRSFEIFGPDLARSRLIVVSRSLSPMSDVVVARSFEDALQLARQWPPAIFVGGGASIYQQALPFADRLHLSVIEGRYEGDAFFPEFDERDWRPAVTQRHARFRYYEYVRSA